MDGRKFLNPAQAMVVRPREEDWRAAAGRAYYALMLECRDAMLRWGFTIPKRDNVHTFVRLRFSRNGDPDLEIIGIALERLCQLRNEADYDIARPGHFTTAAEATRALQKARDTIALLDEINSDPTKHAAALTAIRTAWP